MVVRTSGGLVGTLGTMGLQHAWYPDPRVLTLLTHICWGRKERKRNFFWGLFDPVLVRPGTGPTRYWSVSVLVRLGIIPVKKLGNSETRKLGIK